MRTLVQSFTWVYLIFGTAIHQLWVTFIVQCIKAAQVPTPKLREFIGKFQFPFGNFQNISSNKVRVLFVAHWPPDKWNMPACGGILDDQSFSMKLLIAILGAMTPIMLPGIFVADIYTRRVPIKDPITGKRLPGALPYANERDLAEHFAFLLLLIELIQPTIIVTVGVHARDFYSRHVVSDATHIHIDHFEYTQRWAKTPRLLKTVDVWNELKTISGLAFDLTALTNILDRRLNNEEAEPYIDDSAVAMDIARANSKRDDVKAARQALRQQHDALRSKFLADTRPLMENMVIGGRLDMSLAALRERRSIYQSSKEDVSQMREQYHQLSVGAPKGSVVTVPSSEAQHLALPIMRSMGQFESWQGDAGEARSSNNSKKLKAFHATAEGQASRDARDAKVNERDVKERHRAATKAGILDWQENHRDAWKAERKSKAPVFSPFATALATCGLGSRLAEFGFTSSDVDQKA